MPGRAAAILVMMDCFERLAATGREPPLFVATVNASLGVR